MGTGVVLRPGWVLPEFVGHWRTKRNEASHNLSFEVGIARVGRDERKLIPELAITVNHPATQILVQIGDSAIVLGHLSP